MIDEPNPPRAMPPGRFAPLAPYRAPAASDLRTLAYVVHGLYAASYLTGFTAIVGVVIAHIKRAEAEGTIYESHFTYAIRTFWIGLAMSVVSVLLCLVVIGIFLLMLVGIWFIVRIVRAFLALSEDRPIANPTGFL